MTLMTARRYSILLGHAFGCAVVIFIAVLAGGFAGLVTSDAQRWPYTVAKREIVSDRVTPGAEGGLAMRRVIDYHDEDCWRQYDRRAVSKVATGPKAGMVYRPPSIIEQRLPAELSGKPQTWSTTLPEDFPCGPAYLVETVTAACTWFQRNIRLLHKPDIITPFEVIGCAAPPG